MGKNVTNNYDVVVKRDKDNKLCSRPFIKELTPDIEWEEICEYEGEAQFSYLGRTIYISEDEEVIVTEQVFRADLGNYIQYTNKVLSEDEGNKESCETNLAALLKEYNKQMIEDDERAKAYCNLHKLDYEESDYDEIIKIIGKEEIKSIADTYFDSPTRRSWYKKLKENLPDHVEFCDYANAICLDSIW